MLAGSVFATFRVALRRLAVAGFAVFFAPLERCGRGVARPAPADQAGLPAGGFIVAESSTP